MTAELQYTDGDFYEVHFDFERGYEGSYTQAPEPHTVEINAIYDDLGESVRDCTIQSYFEDEIYYMVDRLDF